MRVAAAAVLNQALSVALLTSTTPRMKLTDKRRLMKLQKQNFGNMSQ